MEDFRTLYWTTLCEFMPSHIDWLTEARNSDSSNSMWLNHSIVSYTAAMTEGAVESMLRTKLFNECRVDIESTLPEGTFSERVAANLDRDIRSAKGWDSLKKLFKVVAGVTLAEMVKDDAAINAVSNLFKLRNSATAHGRAINSVRTEGSPEFSWESSNLNEVQEYLININVWAGEDSSGIPEPSNFFTDEIADHFYDQALKMLSILGAPPTTPSSTPTGRTKKIVDAYSSNI